MFGVWQYILEDPQSASNVIDIPVESQHSLISGFLESVKLGAESCHGAVVDKALRLGGDSATPRLAKVSICLIAVLGERRELAGIDMLMVTGFIS